MWRHVAFRRGDSAKARDSLCTNSSGNKRSSCLRFAKHDPISNMSGLKNLDFVIKSGFARAFHCAIGGELMENVFAWKFERHVD